MQWNEMSAVQRHRTVQAMESSGGGFVHKLALAMYQADSGNMGRLMDAFPELAEKYGPGTYFFDLIEAKHRGDA